MCVQQMYVKKTGKIKQPRTDKRQTFFSLFLISRHHGRGILPPYMLKICLKKQHDWSLCQSPHFFACHNSHQIPARNTNVITGA